MCELILRESNAVLRRRPGLVVAVHRSGVVLANAGIDQSNVAPDGGETVLLLPEDADDSARRLRRALAARTGRCDHQRRDRFSAIFAYAALAENAHRRLSARPWLRSCDAVRPRAWWQPRRSVRDLCRAPATHRPPRRRRSAPAPTMPLPVDLWPFSIVWCFAAHDRRCVPAELPRRRALPVSFCFPCTRLLHDARQH